MDAGLASLPVVGIAVAALIAVVLSGLNRLLAQLAFEQSYRRGFFTAGTLFGMYGGLLGLLFVQTWRVLEKPNLYNEMQLQSSVDFDHQRWRNGLLLGQAGWAVVYWQLLMPPALHRPELAPAWGWLGALALMVAGFFQFRGACPPEELLKPVQCEDADEPEDLLRHIDLRHRWGVHYYGGLQARRLAALLVVVAAAAVLAALSWLVFAGGVFTWILSGIGVLIAATAIGGFLLLRNHAEDLLFESEQFVLQAAPSPPHAKLLKMQRQCFEEFSRLIAIQNWQRYVILGLLVPFILSLVMLIATGLAVFGWVFTISLVLLVAAGVAIAVFNAANQQLGDHFEQDVERCNQLAEELEEEMPVDFQQNRQKYLGEVYHFTEAGLIGQKREMPEGLQRRVNEGKLLEADRRELQAERSAQREVQAQLLFGQFMQAERIGCSRDLTLVLATAILIMAALSYMLNGAPAAVRLLAQTGLACVVYAALLRLAQRVPALRNTGCWMTVGLLFYIAVIVMVFKAGGMGIVGDQFLPQ